HFFCIPAVAITVGEKCWELKRHLLVDPIPQDQLGSTPFGDEPLVHCRQDQRPCNVPFSPSHPGSILPLLRSFACPCFLNPNPECQAHLLQFQTLNDLAPAVACASCCPYSFFCESKAFG